MPDKFSTTGIRLYLLPLDFDDDIRRLDKARNFTLFEGGVWTGTVLTWEALSNPDLWPDKYVDVADDGTKSIVRCQLLDPRVIDPINNEYPDPRDPKFDHVNWAAFAIVPGEEGDLIVLDSSV